MADETSECWHIEQMAIVLRYFEEKQIKPIVKCLCQSIILKLNEKWESVLCIYFDGPSSMTDKKSGVQSKCKIYEIKKYYMYIVLHIVWTLYWLTLVFHELNNRSYSTSLVSFIHFWFTILLREFQHAMQFLKTSKTLLIQN